MVSIARKRLIDLTFPTEKIVATLVEVRDCAEDRTAIVLLFALLDDLIIELMKRNFNQKVKGGINKLFEGSGIIGTANSRILMCSALNWLSDQTILDLDLMRKIRNEFAHKVSTRTLDQIPVCDYIVTMSASEHRYFDAVASFKTSPDEVRALTGLSLREKMFIRGVDLVYRICAELSTFELAKLHQVDFRHLLAREGGKDGPTFELLLELVKVVRPVLEKPDEINVSI